jgi:YD repeat-containing protein
MTSVHSIDEDLVRRLPLPLAQLYRRAHNAHGAQNRHQAAYFLWEAALKLLGCTAVAEYAARNQPDPALTERLSNLARPAVGHWWEFVRLLVPVLADGGDEPFGKVRDLLLGRSRDDLPRAAGLDAALREVLDGTSGARSTVRLSELFERLVRYRNRELGHGALGLRPAEFYERMGAALLAGVAEVLSWLDVLAGRRLLYVGEVRQAGGVWVAQRHELVGEAPRSVAPLELPRDQAAQLPDGERLYLEESTAPPRPLFPLLLHDAETMEVLFLNARRGQQRTEYLSYATGRTVERKDLVGAQQSLLAQLLGLPVDAGQLREWAERAETEEERAAPVTSESASAPRRRVGEFEVFSELGRGGMGIVYRAWQPSLGRQVALKKLLRAGDPRTEARFLREIKALGRVEHPNLVKVFTSGSEGDDWFYAMELVEGADLDGVCEQLAKGAAPTLADADWQRAVTTACDEARRRERPLSDGGPPVTAPPAPPAAPPPIAVGRGQEYVTRVAEVVRQAAEAAHALHEAGVVHRDIKPGNILVTPDGEHAVLMDLGLAQLADEMDRKLTRTREFIGTLRYASPEQVLAVAPVDRRSDVYSLGATLWEMLTLRPLYGATEQTSSPELMQRIQTQDAESVRKHNPRVPRDLEAIVLKCLEKDPQRRYPTAQSLADDLGRFLRHEPVQARPIGPIPRTLRRIRRRPAVAIALLLFAAAVPTLLGIGYWLWDTFERIKVEYYVGEVQQWEAPVGVVRITEEEARHRALSWKFHLRGRRVEKVELINGSGFAPTTGTLMTAAISRSDEPAQVSTLELRRNDRGEVSEVIAKDRFENIQWTFHTSTRTETGLTGYFADERGIARARGGTGAAYVEGVFTPGGYRKELRFLDKSGKPQADAQGVFCYQYEYEDRGLATRTLCLGADGKPVRNKLGFAEMTAKYDEHGNGIEMAYLDAAGRPTRSSDGIARWVGRYDAYGNLIETAAFDEAGQPTRSKSGFARWTARYDERGNRIEEAYFDEAGQPTLSSEGIARWVGKYDERGNRTETAYFDAAGRPTRDATGTAGWTGKYNSRGNQEEVTYVDEAGQPTRNNGGVARLVYQCDERGRRTEIADFDEAGRPTRHRDGNAVRRTKYDERGNAIETAFFDELDRPVRLKSGYARWTAEYDEGGNRIHQAYFDEAGRPTRLKTGGYAIVQKKFDERGNVAETAYLDEAGRPARNKEDRCARVTERYDDRGDLVEESYFDEAGRLTRNKDGYARVTAAYDRTGNLTDFRFFDAEGRPTWSRNGYARLANQYDDRGNMVESVYLDELDRPARHRDGNAMRRKKYDGRGRTLEESYFDEAGRPTRISAGYAKIAYQYDARGNTIDEAYFDEAGKPTKVADGYASIRSKYNERSLTIQYTYHDEAGRPTRDSSSGVAGWTAKYDERGNRVETTYLDEAGQPMRHAEGNTTWRVQYDAHGNRIEEAFLDARGQLVRTTARYARLTNEFDERDNRIAVRYWDEKGQPALNVQGIAGWTAKYDERDNQTEQVFIDKAAQPMRIKAGYARLIWKYDERDNVIEEACFNEAGQLTRSADGYARTVTKYDDRGNETEKASYDDTGKPVTGSAGFARSTEKYDSRGNLTERLYYDADGKVLTPQVLVSGIEWAGQAARLGLQRGDILMTYDGQPVTDTAVFISQRRQEPSGDKARELIVQRGSKRLSFSVTPGLLGATLRNQMPRARAK